MMLLGNLFYVPYILGVPPPIVPPTASRALGTETGKSDHPNCIGTFTFLDCIEPHRLYIVVREKYQYLNFNIIAFIVKHAHEYYSADADINLPKHNNNIIILVN